MGNVPKVVGSWSQLRIIGGVGFAFIAFGLPGGKGKRPELVRPPPWAAIPPGRDARVARPRRLILRTGKEIYRVGFSISSSPLEALKAINAGGVSNNQSGEGGTESEKKASAHR